MSKYDKTNQLIDLAREHEQSDEVYKLIRIKVHTNDNESQWMNITLETLHILINAIRKEMNA